MFILPVCVPELEITPIIMGGALPMIPEIPLYGSFPTLVVNEKV